MKILAIGAHHDDVELGCGGTLLAWRARGDEIHVFTPSKSGYSDANGKVIRSDEDARKEAKAAAQQLGATLHTADFATFALEFDETLNQAVIKVIEQVKPDVVFTHWPGDTHHDHHALAQSTVHGCRRVPSVLFYRSNWFDSPQRFDPRFYVDISATLEGKCKLIETYVSENGRSNGAWVNWARAQAAEIGFRVGVKAAEGFEVLKWRG